MGQLFSGFQFKKRQNSTKLVDSGAIISGNVVLKESTSLNNPTFLLAVGAGDLSAAFKVNYALYMGVYYWVTDVTIESNTHIGFVCEVDALATCRADILATNAYCAFDTQPNSEIPDNRLSRSTGKTVGKSESNLPWTRGLTIIIAVTGKGGMSYIQILPTDLNKILDEIANWIDKTIDDVGVLPDWDISVSATELGNLMKAIGETIDFTVKVVKALLKNAMSVGTALDNIRSGIYYPFVLDMSGASVVEVCLGAFETRVYGRLLNPANYTQTYVNQMGINWLAGDWRRRSPYTEVYVFIPYIGLIHVPPDNIIGESSIYLSYYINWTTGMLSVEVMTERVQIGRYSANVAGQFAIGSSNVQPLAVAGAAIGAVGAIASGSGVAIANSAVNIINSANPLPSCIGGAAGGALGSQTAYVLVIYHGTTVEPESISESCGTPSCCQRNLGSLSGYVQTVGVSISSNQRSEIVDKANSLLDGGAFIE